MRYDVLFTLIRKQQRHFRFVDAAFTINLIRNLEHWSDARAASKHSDMFHLASDDPSALRLLLPNVKIPVTLSLVLLYA